MKGTYFYSDSCSGTIWWADAQGATWDGSGQNIAAAGSGGVYGFGEDEAGNVYIAKGGSSGVFKITSDYIFADDFE